MVSLSEQPVKIIRTERGLTISGTRITLYDIIDHLKAQYPQKFIRDSFNLTNEQIDAVLAYIDRHQAEVEVEYQEILKTAEETRQYWEEYNRERFAKIAATPPRKGHELVRVKLEENKRLRASRQS
ncbi:DUF433 domain-containing protein [Roseofilum capinflatum]|uniref:DUF433 domain-containing protein n=1 Tax=Roseofilum capinflatum BLCC-M114 TaxID=3022440 RepID=A0ABT7BBD7_9CYAN|nr:DUF433 domain-containing protein [Roseofilum capinflatum]MDJ1176485.1 DUF433 domain-containing protein [Roseofilum capinflatum BLCC-M114]